MNIRRIRLDLLTCLLLAVCALCSRAYAQVPDIPSTQLLQPAEFAKMLGASQHDKPLILQVGFHTLYAEAHIPGAEYVGPASTNAGRKSIRDRLKRIDRNQSIVIYCGCCPWVKCPNIRAAYAEITSLGFKHVKALYIAHNFGADWVAHGYPVTKGQ